MCCGECTFSVSHKCTCNETDTGHHLLGSLMHPHFIVLMIFKKYIWRCPVKGKVENHVRHHRCCIRITMQKPPVD